MTDVDHATDGGRRRQQLFSAAQLYAPGVLVCVLAGMAARFISEHYGAPAMLIALLMGLALHFLSEEGRCVAGIAFTTKTILRIGVALLGVRMSVELLRAVGLDTILLLMLAVGATILFGLLAARLLGQNRAMGILTGVSVAICGASAAMAIGAVLPQSKDAERNLIFTVLGVTVMSTIAMVLYPIITSFVHASDHETGIFLGATIHDVAQVVGAGFSVSNEAGETATLVKLIRVTLLAPVVFAVSLILRHSSPSETGGERPPLIPGFVLGFLALAALSSLHLIPKPVEEGLTVLSGWMLIFGIAAVGMRASLKSLGQVGLKAIILLAAETIFLMCFIALGLWWLGGCCHAMWK